MPCTNKQLGKWQRKVICVFCMGYESFLLADLYITIVIHFTFTPLMPVISQYNSKNIEKTEVFNTFRGYREKTLS